MEQAARLSGLSKRQVAYWDQTGVFSPSLLRTGAHAPYSRIYSFQDIVALRTLALLRQRVSLDKLRTLGQWLKKHYDHPWSSLRFYVIGNDIAYVDPATQALVSSRPIQQAALTVELEPIARDASELFHSMRGQRAASELGRIVQHRYTLRNEWHVASTRIPVWAIQELAESGYSIAETLAEYPELTEEDVCAALAFDLPVEQRAAG